MKNDYKERILHYLNQMSAPVDVEKIRKSSKIANWNTALKHCLQLLIKGKIQGQETTKGWVFWIHQTRHLQDWEEVVGTLNRIESSDTETTAILTCTIQKHIAITLPKDQPETNQLKQLIGKRIAIIKTDNPQKPYAIRTFTETPDAVNTRLQGLGLRRSLLWVALKFDALKFALWLFGLRLR